MKKFVTLMTLGLAMSVGSALAATHAGAPMAGASAPKASASAPAMTKQQTRMGDCNKDAKEKNLKGDERKKFMSSCLSA